ncbi:MAG: ribonuclease H-like domain-containing protein [bacterium]
MNPDAPKKHDKAQRRDQLLASLKGRLHRASDLLGTTESGRPTGPPLSLDAIYPGVEVRSNSAGEFAFIKTEYRFGDQPENRGFRFPFHHLVESINLKRAAFLGTDPEVGGLSLSELAFVDTETTGLAGGTGTYAFLIGVGYFRKGGFTVEQYFMEDYCNEPALIEALRQRMKKFEGLVTYNGKAFDVPLLRSRFIFNRTPSVWELPHFDLLGPCRRIFRRRLGQCNLGSVESSVLGVRRESDVDGAVIPSIYFDYIRGLRRERMIPVLDHNVQDILSIGSLLCYLSDFVQCYEHERFPHAEDLMGLARLHELRGELSEARRCLEHAVGRAREGDQSLVAGLQLGRLFKKAAEWEKAIEVWGELCRHSPLQTLEPYIELAKYYEHRARETQKAKMVVERALERLRSEQELRSYLDDWESKETTGQQEALAHRLDRLQRRLEKKGLAVSEELDEEERQE